MEFIKNRLADYFRCSIQLVSMKLILIVLVVPFCCILADTCPNDTFESFKVSNLSQCSWTLKGNNQNCVGYSTIQTCVITMGFCHALKSDTGCETSSVCVQTVNGTGDNKTISYNVGEFRPNTNPYYINQKNPNLSFIAKFNGSQYTRKDGSNCTLSSEIQFSCRYDRSWVPKVGEKTSVPLAALPNVTFNQSTCKFVVTVFYDGACQAIAPPVPVPDPELSLGSVFIIIFVVVVSTYFLFGCTFKYCYGFRGREVLPHSDFWVDLPSLIVDGMLFTVKCGKTDMSRTYDGI